MKSGVAMVRISGTGVRRLREEQELTQLYLATAVGVTTETISRWERKETPTVKKENGLKLAEALGVSLEKILAPMEEVLEESAETVSLSGQASVPSVLVPAAFRKKVIWATALLLGVFLLLLFFLSRTGNEVTPLAARRIMPAHVVAGHPFPVVIAVTSGSGKNFSLLLKEELPAGSRLLRTVPQATVVDSNFLKWIDKNGSGERVFAYLVILGTDGGGEDSFSFKGSLLVRHSSRSEIQVSGRSRIRLLSFHWADSDRNNVIDDEEFLAVYDDFGRLEGLGVDVEEVESIWMGSGYRWDAGNTVFEVIP
jgi:transcriptional regulator with XRE-family HTH domain